MKIAIANRQRRWPIEAKRLRKVAEMILSDLGCPDSELSISIVGDRTIRRINRDYLDRDKTTNVISFAMHEGEFGQLNPQMLGDVIVCADTAAREAEEGASDLFTRISFLLLHGILHITGYDHERSGEAEAARMEKRESEIFAHLSREGLVQLG